MFIDPGCCFIVLKEVLTTTKWFYQQCFIFAPEKLLRGLFCWGDNCHSKMVRLLAAMKFQTRRCRTVWMINFIGGRLAIIDNARLGSRLRTFIAGKSYHQNSFLNLIQDKRFEISNSLVFVTPLYQGDV